MATRSRTTGMWGLDMTEGRLRLVHVVLRRNGGLVTHAVRIPIAPGSSEQATADVLSRAVEGSELDCRQIALCLPAADGAIVPTGTDKPDLAGDDFASLDFSTPDGRGFIVRGRRSTAARMARIAALAGLEPVCIMPLQAALAVSGDFFKRRDDHASGVAVFVGQSRVHILHGHDGVVRTCRSAPRPKDCDGYGQDVADMVIQFFSALSATRDSVPWPEFCDIFADGINASQLRELTERLGVSCRAASPAMRSGVVCEQSLINIYSAFSAATGAALTAMGLPDIKVDLSSEVFVADTQPDKGHSRLWSVSVVFLALAAIGMMMAGRISRRLELIGLEREYEQVKPKLERSSAITEQWTRMRSWLSVEDGGTRVAQLKILDRMIELFPDASLAYVSDLDFDARSNEVQVSVKGRASGSEVLHECISRLNESGYFQARMGPVSDVEQAQAYPKKYYIPMTYTVQDIELEP